MSTPRPNVNSTAVSIFGTNYLGSEHACIIDSIFICNTTNKDILINVYTLCERFIDGVPTAIPSFKFNHVLLSVYNTIELLKGVGFTMEQGDLIFAFTNDPKHFCDTNVSYRELLET